MSGGGVLSSLTS